MPLCNATTCRETSLSEVSRQGDSFVDFEKVVNNNNRQILWTVMENTGYPLHLIRAVQSTSEIMEVTLNIK